MRITTQKLNWAFTKQLFNGWRNVLISNEKVEKLASTRMEQCTPCPHKTQFTCGLCGCPLKAKVRTLDATCPDGKW